MLPIKVMSKTPWPSASPAKPPVDLKVGKMLQQDGMTWVVSSVDGSNVVLDPFNPHLSSNHVTKDEANGEHKADFKGTFMAEVKSQSGATKEDIIQMMDVFIDTPVNKEELAKVEDINNDPIENQGPKLGLKITETTKTGIKPDLLGVDLKETLSIKSVLQGENDLALAAAVAHMTDQEISELVSKILAGKKKPLPVPVPEVSVETEVQLTLKLRVIKGDANIVSVIKLVRSMTGMGLYEAKMAVDHASWLSVYVHTLEKYSGEITKSENQGAVWEIE